MSKLVISGGSGLLGTNWAINRRDVDSVHILLNSRLINISGVTSHQVSLQNQLDIRKLLKTLKPDFFIHTAGMTDINSCQKYPELSKTSNIHVAFNTAKICYELGINFIHISTDHLFNGVIPYNDERAVLSPLNTYAKHKVEAEKLVMGVNPKALVVRTNFFGWGPEYRKSFSDEIINKLETQQSFPMFDDVFFTPLSTRRLIDLVHQAMNKKCTGIVNFTGGERVSKYDFSVYLAKAFGFDSNIIQPVQASRVINSTNRPRELSLSDKKMRKILKIKPISINDVIEDLRRDEEIRDEVTNLGQIIPYGKHYLDEDDIDAVVSTLRSNYITQGPAIEAFEKRIADYVGAKYAVAVSSATAGLHLAYKTLGVCAGKSILTTPITFVATANASIFCGGTVRFADINASTINMGFDKVREALENDPNIHIVAPVIFSGASEGIPELAKLGKSYGKFIVEDAAHGLGGSYSCGAMIGSCKYSDCTVFSLHPVKSIAAGEGGVITTNDSEIYKSLIKLRTHGITQKGSPFVGSCGAYTDGKMNPWYYEMTDLGYHYRFTDIQASLANSQMNKIDLFINRRRELAHRYVAELESIPNIELAQSIDINHSANHLLAVKIDFEGLKTTRQSYMTALQKEKIYTQVHYIPVFTHPYYKYLNLSLTDFPNSLSYYNSALSLPLYYSYTDMQFELVIENLKVLSGLNSKNC